MRKLCSAPHCRNLQPCPVHTAASTMAAYNRARRAVGPAFYNTAQWKRTRIRYLTDHPRCVVCGAPATDVDHVHPRPRGHAFDPEGWDNDRNLQALCSRHHKAKTMRETNARHRQPA